MAFAQNGPPPPPGYQPPPPGAPAGGAEGYEPKHGSKTHDGFYLRLGLGPNLLSFKPKVGDTISGTGGGFDLAIGGTLGGGFVLAGDFSYTQFAKSQGPFNTTYKFATFSLLGDYFIDPKGPWHIQAAVGSAGADACVESTCGGIGNGLAFTLGGGYDAFVSDEWSLGGLLRFQRAGLKRDSQDIATATNIQILFTALYH